MAAAGLRAGANSGGTFDRDGNTFIPAFLPDRPDLLRLAA
jgi:hypothetical protein